MLALLVAAAAAHASATAICADIANRLRDKDATVEDIASVIQRDDRTYTYETLECLCVIGAPPEVHREARRRMLRDAVPVDATEWTVHTADPLTTPNFQVSVLLSRRLQAAGRQVPFFALPTQLQTPDWLDVDAVFSSVRTFEVPGARLATPEVLSEFGLTSLPEGEVGTLADAGTLQSFDLLPLHGTYDRALWFDLSGADEVRKLTWMLLEVGYSAPYDVLSAEGVTLRPVSEPIVPSCADPAPRTMRRWKGRLEWPAGRVGTAVAGAVLAGIFGGLTLNEYLAYDAAEAGALGTQDNVTRNIAFGTIAIAGGVMSVSGLAIPGRLWRR